MFKFNNIYKKIIFLLHENVELLYQHDVTNGDCVPLPSQLQDAAGSLITENCLLIFTDASCVGTSIKVDPIGQNGRYNLYDVKHSSDEHFGRRVKSFKICNKFEGGNEVNVDFYTSSSSLGKLQQNKFQNHYLNIVLR